MTDDVRDGLEAGVGVGVVSGVGVRIGVGDGVGDGAGDVTGVGVVLGTGVDTGAWLTTGVDAEDTEGRGVGDALADTAITGDCCVATRWAAGDAWLPQPGQNSPMDSIDTNKRLRLIEVITNILSRRALWPMRRWEIERGLASIVSAAGAARCDNRAPDDALWRNL